MNLYSKSKWESSGRTPDRFKFRCCEDYIETTLRYFKMTLRLFQVLQKSLSIPLSLRHIQLRVLQMAF